MTARCTSARAPDFTTGPDTYAFNRMQPDGTLDWTIAFNQTRYRAVEGCGVHVDAEGVTFAANLRATNEGSIP